MQSGLRVIAATQDDRLVSLRRAMLLIGAVCAWWLALFASVSGQEATYKVLPVNPQFDTRPDPDSGRVDSAKKAAFGERMRLVNDILTGRASLDDNRAAFDQWYAEVLFPLMTQDSAADLPEIATQRESLFGSLERATSQPAIEHFSRDLALPTFRDIVSDNYHPVVRLNAATIVGRLDQRVGRGRDVAPEPLAEALPVLLQWFEDGALPLYLRVAALYGIERHATIDGQKTAGRWDDATRLRVQTALVSVLAPAAEGADAEADYWMKRLACRALGGAREIGNNGEIAAALRTILNDASMPLLLRCEAAVAYGKMRFADPAQSQAKEVAIEVARLAVEVAEQELASLDETEANIKLVNQFRTAAPAGAPPGMSMMGGAGRNTPALPGGPMGVSGPGGSSNSSSEGAVGGGASANPGSGPGAGRPGSRGPGGSSPGSGSSQGSMGMPGIFGAQGAGAPLDLPAYRYRVSQRRLMTSLYHLQTALKTEGSTPMGLTTQGVSDPLIASISTGLKDLMTAAQAGISDREKLNLTEALSDFRSSVRSKAKALEDLLPAVPGGDAEGGDGTTGTEVDPFSGN